MRLRSQSARTLLYEEVVEELYRLIDEKHIQPGGKLPPERELIEQLKVSRNVLREAFHVLETRGVIVSYQGKGRFLREQPGHGSEKRTESLSKNLERYSMLEAYEVRQVLEVKGVELIIRNASEEDIDDLEKAYKKVEHTYETTGTTTGEFELHKLYAEKTGSMFMTQTLELVLNAILDMMYGQFYDVLEATSEKQELESHRQIIDAIRRRDTEAAQKLMQEHLQVTMDMLRDNLLNMHLAKMPEVPGLCLEKIMDRGRKQAKKYRIMKKPLTKSTFGCYSL